MMSTKTWESFAVWQPPIVCSILMFIGVFPTNPCNYIAAEKVLPEKSCAHLETLLVGSFFWWMPVKLSILEVWDVLKGLLIPKIRILNKDWMGHTHILPVGSRMKVLVPVYPNCKGRVVMYSWNVFQRCARSQATFLYYSQKREKRDKTQNQVARKHCCSEKLKKNRHCSPCIASMLKV